MTDHKPTAEQARAALHKSYCYVEVPGCVADTGAYCGHDECPHGMVEETICSNCACDPHDEDCSVAVVIAYIAAAERCIAELTVASTTRLNALEGLRGLVRQQAIELRVTGSRCRLCYHVSTIGQPESHAPMCTATPPEESR